MAGCMESEQHIHQKQTLRHAVESNEDHLEMAMMNDHERELYIARNTGYHGKLVWCMVNYKEHLQEARDQNLFNVTSPPCFTSPFGYKYCMRVHLHAHDLSISVLQMKTEFDNTLEWPVTHRIQFTLFCPKDHAKNKVRIFEKCVMNKPGHEEVVKNWHFVYPIAKLEKDGFVENNCLLVGFTVE